MANKRRNDENMSIITNVDNFETLLEQYFAYHSNFFWDKAKEFLECERDRLKARHPTCGASIIIALFNALSQLNIAEKNYMQLQFFTQKFLQRKDSVKSCYSSLKYEFQQLEQRGTIITQKSVSIATTQTSPIHYQNTTPTKSLSSTIATALNRIPPGSVETSPKNQSQESEIGQDVLNCTIEELTQPGESPPTPPQTSPSLPVYNEEISTPPPVRTSQSFFSKLFRRTTKSNSLSSSLKPLQESDVDYQTNYDSASKECQDNHIELESVEKFAAHVAGQLVNYVSMRIDMIRWFETLAEVCSNNFCLVEDLIESLRMIFENAEQNFHHPVLSRLKLMFHFECDILLGLLNLHTTIQNFRYLDSLFYLQDSHNKLNLVAALRDQMITQISGNNNVSSVNSSGSGNGFQEKFRRNITSSSLASSIGSIGNSSNAGLQVPPVQSAISGTITASGVPSPSSLANTSFIYPYQSSGIYIQPKFSQRHNNFASMPPLFQWLNRLKQFLLSKYSFYFHSILLNHLGTGSGSNVHDIMKAHLSKQTYDFHHRNVTFLKKFDNTQLVLLFDTHERECNLNGYSSPYMDRPSPQGVNSIPVIYCHPGEISPSRLPSLIMIMNDKSQELNQSNQVVVIDCDKQRHLSMSATNIAIQQQRSSITETTLSLSSQQQQHHHHLTYFLFRPDPDFTFVMICEGLRRPERDILLIIQFLQETCILLRGTKIFTNIKTATK